MNEHRDPGAHTLGVRSGRRNVEAPGLVNADRLLAVVKDGKSLAYVSEADTPLVADPGYKLGVDMRAAGLPLTAAPGASAVLAALTVSSLPTDAFHFAGFLANSTTARRSGLEGLKDLQATVVLYESPKRIHAMLSDLRDVLGVGRNIVICRELTKKFEELLSGTAAQVRQRSDDPQVHAHHP